MLKGVERVGKKGVFGMHWRMCQGRVLRVCQEC